jgi:hypothetical protein
LKETEFSPPSNGAFIDCSENFIETARVGLIDLLLPAQAVEPAAR